MTQAMSEFDHRHNKLNKRFHSGAEPAFNSASESELGWGRS